MLCLHPDLWLARDSGTLRLQAVAAQSSTTAAKRLRRRLPSEGLLTPQTQQQTAERRRPSDADQALLGQDLSLQVHSQLRASPAFFSAPLLSAETLHRKPCYQPLPPVAVPAGAAAASSSSSSFCSSPPKTASAAELAAGRRRVVAGDEGGSAAPEPVSSSVFDAESSHGDARVQGEASTASWSLPMLSPGLSAAQLPCKRKGNAAECLGRRHVLSCPEIDGVLREPDDDDDLHGTEAAAAVSSPKRETSVAVLVGGATPECAAAVSSVSAGGEGALLDDDASDAPPWICAVNAAPLQIQGERAIRSSPAAIRPLRTAERQSPPAPSARPEGVLTEAFIPSTSSLAAPDSLLAAETLFDHGSAEAFSVESFSSPRGAEDLHSSVTAADAASSLAAAAALGDSDSSCADEVSAAEDSAAASSLMDALSPAQTEGGDGAQETSAAASSSRAGGVAGGSLLLQLPPRMLNPVERAASAAVLQAPAAGHSAAAPRRLFGCWPSSSPEASLASCAQAAAAAAAAASSSTASKSSLRILKSGAGGGDSTSTSSGRSSTCAGSSSCGSATSAGRRRSAGKAAVAAAFCRGCAVALVESEAAAAKQQQAPALLSTIALGGSGRVCCACGGRVAAAALSGDAATHSQQQSLAAPPRKDLPPSSGPFQSTTGGGVVVGAAAAVVGAGGGVSAAAGSSSSPSCSFAENAAAVDAAAALASFSFLASPKGIAQQQPQQQPHLQNAAAAAAAAPGPGSRCCSRQTRHTRQSSGFSTSAATATAAGAGASPSSTRAPALRLPIPTRALRRLQKPRAMTQQQLCEGGQEGAARAARRGLVVRPPPLAEDAAAGEGSGSLRWGAQNPSAAVAAGETSAGGVVLNCPCVGGECLSGLHHHTPRHHPLHATPNRTPSASPSLHATPHLQRFRGPSSPSTASFPQSSSNATTTATPVSFGGFFDGDRLGPPSEETRRGGLRPVQQRETHAPAFWIAEDAAGAAEATAVLAAAEDPFHAAAHAAQEAAFAAARAAACAAAHAQELQRRASNTHPQQEPQPPALNKNSAGGGADALSASPEAGDEESLACPGNLGGSGSSAGGCICSRLDLTATTLDGDNLPPPFFCLERQPPRVSVYPDLQRSIRDDFELRFPAGPALAGASLQATAATPAGSASQQQRSAGAGDGVGGTSSMDSAIKNSATTSGVETPTSVAVASTTAAAVSVAGGLCDASNQILIGEGRYGRVILGQHRKTRALVAVKVIEKRRVSDAEGWDCCRQELEIHRRLPRHPHVVEVLDAYEDRKNVYIVQELCDRTSLVDLVLKEGPFPEQQAKVLFAQVGVAAVEKKMLPVGRRPASHLRGVVFLKTAQLVAAVAHCHLHGIVHRDLKPENILFARDQTSACDSQGPLFRRFETPAATHKLATPTSQTSIGQRSSGYPTYPSELASEPSAPSVGENPIFRTPPLYVKLTDFGSACLALPGELRGTVCGTVHYLAPEVLVGKLYDGFSTDVWGLGVILFILLSATPPFHGDCHSELVRNIVGGAFSFENYPWRFVSVEAKDLVRRLLTVDPRRRIALKEIAEHPWFLGLTLDTSLFGSVVDGLCGGCSSPPCGLSSPSDDERGECGELETGCCCCAFCETDAAGAAACGCCACAAHVKDQRQPPQRFCCQNHEPSSEGWG